MDSNLFQLINSTFCQKRRWVLFTWSLEMTHFHAFGDFVFSRKYQMSSLILVIGHICSSLLRSNIKMVTTDEIREYLNTLNSMQIISLRGRLVDKKASSIRQNLEPSHVLLVVLELLREQIHNRFEWIQIILMSVPELLDKIRK